MARATESDPPTTRDTPPRWRAAAIGVGLLALAFACYLPALRAGFIWDDDHYVTQNPTLTSADGLVTMWTDTRSLPQWYPLVHTTFWVEHRLWGLWPAGYHAVNVLLHGLSAVLLWRILRRLRVPGALLAAAVFAAHPVMVESVAWVTERKNTLSLALALAALWCWLRTGSGRGVVDEDTREGGSPSLGSPLTPALSQGERGRTAWVGVYALFLAALFSKTVVASLPAVMLVVVWWKRGRIDWRRDARPLVPMFVVGAILALHTGYLEREHVGATGLEWKYGDTPAADAAARVVIAGRAIAFYAGKLLWPAELMFFYPRWAIDPTAAWQWAFPAAVVGVLVALVLLRNKLGRGPAAVGLVYCGVLFPALGFANVFPHRYSFVADHFQYHAAVALLAGVCAILPLAAARVRLPNAARLATGALLVTLLGTLTFRASADYHDSLTLWQATHAKNPDNWGVLTNLGNALVRAGREKDAEPYFARALEVAPNVYDVQWNAGQLAMRQGRPEDAERHFREALRLEPRFATAAASLSQLLLKQNRLDETAAVLAPLLDNPRTARHPDLNLQAGLLAERRGQLAIAADFFRVAAEQKPDDYDAQYNFGTATLRLRQPFVAAAALERATTLRSTPEAWTNLGVAHRLTGNTAQAQQAFERALQLAPGNPDTLRAMGVGR
jgi:Tfp pilus assembly protein PilF